MLMKILSYSSITKPTELFKVLWYYYLSPKNLLVVHKFNKKGVILSIGKFNL